MGTDLTREMVEADIASSIAFGATGALTGLLDWLEGRRDRGPDIEDDGDYDSGLKIAYNAVIQEVKERIAIIECGDQKD